MSEDACPKCGKKRGKMIVTHDASHGYSLSYNGSMLINNLRTQEEVAMYLKGFARAAKIFGTESVDEYQPSYN